MTMQTQTRPSNGQGQQAHPVAEKSEFEKLIERDFKMQTEYTPFLGKEAIKLSPSIVIKYLCKPTREGFVCTEEQAVRFIMLCKARGLNPWEGDAYVVGYDTRNGPEFNLVTAIQAFLKRAEVHPQYDGMESGVTVMDNESEALQDIEGDFFTDDCTLVGGWARVHFKNRKIPLYRRLSLKVFNKGFSVWASNPAGMIVKCAEADALRSAFPNSLGGMYMEDEMPSEDRPAAATPSRPSRLDSVIQSAAVANPPKNPTTPPAETGPAPAESAGDAGSQTDVSPSASASPAPQPAPGLPSWDQLAEQGITYIAESDGIAVQMIDGETCSTLRPDGKFDAHYSAWTVQPNTPEQDQLAREMTVKALAGNAAAPTQTEAKTPPARAGRPRNGPPRA